MLPNLKRLMNSRIVGSLALAMSLASFGTVRAQSDDDRPPPLLRGGLVHQLRSLSEDALDSLQLESSSGPARTSAGRNAQTSKGAVPQPPQPSGRATLQRTHASPWIERFQEPAGPAAADFAPPSRVEPTSGSGRGSKPIPLRDPPARGSSQELRSPASMSNQNNQPRAPRPNVIEDGRPLPPILSGAAIKAAQQPAVPVIPEVHVAESLPPEIKQSISPLSNSFDASTTGSDSYDAEADDSESDSKPQVSRIPLPSRPDGATRQGARLRTRSSQADTTTTASPNGSELNNISVTAESGVPAELTSSQMTDRSSASRGQQIDDSSLPSFPALSTEATSLPTLPSFPDHTSADEAGMSTDARPLAGNPQEPSLPSLPEIPSLPGSQPSLPSLPLGALPPTDVLSTDIARQQDVVPPSVGAQRVEPELPTSLSGTAVEPQLPAVLLPPASGRATAAEIQRRETSAYAPAPVQAQTSGSTGENERLRMETPRIAVLLEGPEDLPVGQPAEYAIRVVNQDSISLSGLVLRMDVPAGVITRPGKVSRGELQVEQAPDATLLTWMFEGLEPGGTATAPIQLTAQSARNFGLAMEWTIVPITGSTGVAVRAPALELMLEGPSEVVFGEANTYRLRIKNPGSADARNVAITLTAESYGSSSSEIGTVRAGAEEVVDIELTFNQEGSINIAAAAKADSDLTSTTRIDVLVQRANLVASVDVPAFVYHGTETDYVIRIANTGNAPAKDVRAAMTLPAGAKLINLPDNTQLADGVLSWTVGDVAAGATADLPMQLSLLSEGENELKVDCRSASGLTANCVSQTVVKAVSDLKLFVADPIAPAPIGSEVVYELTLTNRGSKAATGVKVVAQFSEGIEPVRGEGTKSRVVPGQVIFEPLKRIEPGQTVQLKVIALADGMGTHRFRAEVRTDDTSVRLVQEASTAFLEGVGRIAAPMSGRPVVR